MASTPLPPPSKEGWGQCGQDKRLLFYKEIPQQFGTKNLILTVHVTGQTERKEKDRWGKRQYGGGKVWRTATLVKYNSVRDFVKCIAGMKKGIIGLGISVWIAFVNWIMYSIDSCLVIVIISSYYHDIYRVSAFCRYFDPLYRISGHE